MTIHDSSLLGIRNKIGQVKDFSRSYLFNIKVSALGSNFGNDSTLLTAFIESTTLPDFKLKVKSVEFQTIKLQIVEGVDFSNTWTVNFLSDDSQLLRSTLLAWSSYCWDIHRKAATTPISYRRTATIQQLNIRGKPIAEYTMYGFFPSRVAGTDLNNSNDGLSKFTVDFAYDYFSVEFKNDVSTQPKQEETLKF